MSILDPEYIKEQAHKPCFWSEEFGFDVVAFTHAMEQNYSNRVGSKINALKKELAAEREKRAADNAQYTENEIEWNKELAAAQATIAQMREALKIVAQSHAWTQFGECRSFGSDAPLLNPSDADRLAHKALALQTNQDALHEALARECERLAGVVTNSRHLLREEAAAHRARKEGK